MKFCVYWLKKGLLISNFLIFSAFVAPTHVSNTHPSNPSVLKASKFNQTTSDSEERIVVPFGNSLDYILNNDVSWQIINSETNILYQEGIGNLKGIEFPSPGNYTLHINEKIEHSETECNHAHFPDKIYIEVAPYNMVFDLSTVKLSKDIKGNQSVNGTTLTVDVIFSSWEGKAAIYEKEFKTSGVRTSIIGKLKKGSIQLQQGKNTLEFQLEGQASNNTYIRIDFIDINGQIQSYSFTNKII